MKQHKIHWWNIKHRVWAKVICLAMYAILLAFVLHNDWDLFVLFLFVFGYIFVAIGIDNAHVPILNEAMKALNIQCDPFPMLLDTEKLLNYKHNDANRLMIVINHCVGLRNVGRYTEAYKILQENYCVYNPKIPTIHKIVYCNNMADICRLLGKVEGAQDYVDELRSLL